MWRKGHRQTPAWAHPTREKRPPPPRLSTSKSIMASVVVAVGEVVTASTSFGQIPLYICIYILSARPTPSTQSLPVAIRAAADCRPPGPRLPESDAPTQPSSRLTPPGLPPLPVLPTSDAFRSAAPRRSPRPPHPGPPRFRRPHPALPAVAACRPPRARRPAPSLLAPRAALTRR
ncbi:hypothetical protein GUJ93_ZPchr0006g43816 [Zizania palustris]|uniref:Uncharacterized protein n=1 Tax=Zizania palustris TaxID=103762 RepID=A0A8J5SKP5_ZIZPA|nr:hypothetical protein GUJ93_ZPchr0006g43816 [Zizania palustris]